MNEPDPALPAPALDFDLDPAARTRAALIREASQQLMSDAHRTDPEQWRAAAGSLLDMNDPAAAQVLQDVLAWQSNAAVRKAVVEAILAQPAAPPDALALPLARQLSDDYQRDPAFGEQIITALARFTNPIVTQEFASLSRDAQQPMALRTAVVQALGRHRTQAAAGALVALLDPQHPAALRTEALASLVRLTALDPPEVPNAPDPPDAPQAWQAWWREVQALDPQAWQAHLLENFARRDERREREQELLSQRLIESHRNLYRATAPEQRPAVLVSMLADALAPVRQAGVNLAVQRMVDDLPFEAPLREALRERLADPLPQIRQRVALLLRDLADDAAVDRVADRLAAELESQEPVLRANLLLLSRLPRVEAFEPALALLQHETLWGDAAATLAALAEAGLLDAAQADRVLRRVRARVDVAGPTPQAVQLLAQIGDERDWQRIAVWLDSEDEAIRRATARVWSESDRSLASLAERVDDPMVQPALLQAALRRGRSPVTLEALVSLHLHKQTPSDAALWERALVAVAGRTPGEAALHAAQQLEEHGASRELCEQMLTAALDAQRTPELAEQEQLLGRLLMERARLRLLLDDAAGAVQDYDRAATMNTAWPGAQRQQLRTARIQANLLAGQVEHAMALLREGGEPSDAPAPDADGPALPAQLFLNAAERHIVAGRFAEAEHLLAQLRLLIGAEPEEAVGQRLATLQQQIVSAAAPVDKANDEGPRRGNDE